MRGFSRVEAVDYSENAILRMREEQERRLMNYARNPPVRPPPHPFKVDYRIMDVTKMTYPDRSVDCVIDKATLDTMKQLDDDDDDDDLENFDPGATKRAPRATPNRTRRGCSAKRVASSNPAVTTSASRTANPRRDSRSSIRRQTTGSGSGQTRWAGRTATGTGTAWSSREQGDVLCVRVQEEDGCVARGGAGRGRTGGRDRRERATDVSLVSA